jgi:metal-responsive CopG/Arc/MetJ family transcriptional regulator
MPQQQESEHKTFIERDVVVVSFALDKEILDAINKRVGNHKGRRSEFARQVFRKALNI